MQNSPLILTFSRQGSNHSMDSRQEHAGMTEFYPPRMGYNMSSPNGFVGDPFFSWIPARRTRE